MEYCDMEKEQKRLNKLEFLKAKKARDGKLNKLGEWLLSIECKTGWSVEAKDMKYVLR
jgi:hypothetical protein